jgi:hypothetical protein
MSDMMRLVLRYRQRSTVLTGTAKNLEKKSRDTIRNAALGDPMTDFD